MIQDGIIEIGGESVSLAQGGMAQVKRLSKATQFLNTYGKAAIKDVNFQSLDENSQTDMLTIIISLLGTLDEGAWVLVGEFVSGKDKEFVKENFDLEWVIEGLTWLLQTGPYRKLVDRFFGRAE